MDDEYKIKTFGIILPKLSPYVKTYDGDVLFDWSWWIIKKNIMIFGIKSAKVLKNNLIANLSTTKKFPNLK